MTYDILLFIIGLAFLIVGAEILVFTAVRIAAGLKIRPFITGLTIVAFGTGAPELLVGTYAGHHGQGGIALGNVIGSNLVNTLGILGFSAVISPIVIHSSLVKIDIPIMILATALFYALSWYGAITPAMGALLVLIFIGYITFSIFKARTRDEKEFKEEYSDAQKFLTWGSFSLYFIYIAVAIFLLAIGAKWVVDSAAAMADAIGSSQLFLGLTIVSLGTTLPEIVTAAVATYHGKQEVVVGDIIGSNIFNLLAVLGCSSFFSPNGIAVPESVLYFYLPILMVSAITCLPIFLTDNEISRSEGILFLMYYAVFNAYIVLTILKYPSVSCLRLGMLYFAIPLTALNLGVSVFRHFQSNKKT